MKVMHQLRRRGRLCEYLSVIFILSYFIICKCVFMKFINVYFYCFFTAFSVGVNCLLIYLFFKLYKLYIVRYENHET